MSRIGRQPITLPKGVTVEVGAGVVKVKGAKGELSVTVHPDLVVKSENGVVTVSRPSDSRTHKSLHGLTRTLIANAVQGVSVGYVKELVISGTGYRAAMQGKNLELTVGHSHKDVVVPPPGIAFEVPEPTRIRVVGIDKQLVGQVAANVRSVRPPDAYHAKGIRYANEVVKTKPGKTAGK
ncbi:50S ribosomal protein L6 [Meiothermus luteus]|uniref:Large ribosomal subunit protein uL6 n=1 Tax=Meiothermus luteus TaxID=2026184 RepID=A0A399EL08_9DEIN|nr:50S ribosomal protein L6 [Meiothermus luteus]RIH84143.1 50S ribosomal protein L6 [Meiothermus luteus]RMH55889.1 MAG: 50S ribosomal protein L6 [Deinococcota bacterium]